MMRIIWFLLKAVKAVTRKSRWYGTEMTLRAYRRTAQTETEDKNCTETSKEACTTQGKSQRCLNAYAECICLRHKYVRIQGCTCTYRMHMLGTQIRTHSRLHFHILNAYAWHSGMATAYTCSVCNGHGQRKASSKAMLAIQTQHSLVSICTYARASSRLTMK
jgi:hypothetical protein